LSFGFADVSRGITEVRARPGNELRGQTIGLLEHTNGVVCAIRILAVDLLVMVVVNAVVANLGNRSAIRSEETRRIGTIDLIVAIVVLAVVTDLGSAILACWRYETGGIGAIDELVAIFIDAPRTYFGFAGRHASAGENTETVGIRTVDEQIAIVIRLIVAKFGRRLARTSRRPDAIEIITIDAAVTIVIETIVAIQFFIRQAATCRRALTIGIETVNNGIAIVVDTVATLLAGRCWRTSAIRSLCTRKVVAIGDAIAIIVRAIGAILGMARINLRIEVIAIAATA
jgi:hypothetical protein